jgi:hypothetical protein
VLISVGSLQPFFSLAIYSQKSILKIKSAKIKCHLRIFNSQNSTKISEKSPDYCTWLPYIDPKIQKDGFFQKLLSYLAWSQNMAKCSCGSSPLWLHHKIDKKNTGNSTSP